MHNKQRMHHHFSSPSNCINHRSTVKKSKFDDDSPYVFTLIVSFSPFGHITLRSIIHIFNKQTKTIDCIIL